MNNRAFVHRWLPAVVAAAVVLTIAFGSRLALAGDSGTAKSRPDAPTAYNLQGDASNNGTSTTVFSTTRAGGSSFYGWAFYDTRDGDITIYAGGTTVGLFAEGTSYGVEAHGTGHGVHAESPHWGVYAIASDGEGAGAFGYNNGALTAIGRAPGVRGDSNNGAGVQGYGGKYGVLGFALGGTSSYGGYFSATTGIGLYANSNSNTGVYGVSGNGIGVYGQSSSNIGIYGKSTSGSGIYAQSTSGIGMYGGSSSSYGLYVSTVTGLTTLRAINPNKSSGYYAGYFDGNVRINGSYVATGTKSALVYTNQGERLMYVEEATQNYFSDQGTAYLKDGRAVIKIDPLFAQTVSLSEGYQVFLTPASFDTMGLAVGNQSAVSFEVRELNNGKGRFSFHWRISALRKGYEKERMSAAPPEIPTVQDQPKR